MDSNGEKRMAGDYVIIHAFHIGDREIVLGENPSGVDGERYMCAFCQSNGLMAGYTEVMVSDDYPELAKLFGERIAEQAEKTRIDLNGPKIQGIHNSASAMYRGLWRFPQQPGHRLPLHRIVLWQDFLFSAERHSRCH